MGNAEICQQCQNLQVAQQPKNTHKKRIRSRTIFQNEAQIYDQSSKSPKKIVKIEAGIYQVSYPDGGVYLGEMLGQLRHGKGKQTWPGGHFYDGEWENDKGQGQGILKTNDFLFEGQMIENRPVKGKMTLLNKKKQEIYEGDLKDFMYHGKGTLTVKNEYVYKGNFQNNKKHGKGILVFTNGSEYEGDFDKGAMSGNASFKTADLEYVGQFQSGQIHGYGKCAWKNGAIYIGNYVYGSKEGYGEYTYEDGRTYKGLWKKGKPCELCYTFGKDKQQNLY